MKYQRRCAGIKIGLAVIAVCVLMAAVPVSADPCLVVYPTGVCSYHYDVNEYYTVTTGHPLYDPMYARNGEVLLEWGTDAVDLSIYQAPGLASFEPSTDGEEGYFLIGTDFDLVVDGYSNNPTTYENILIVFVPDPAYCMPIITIDGNPALTDPGLGQYYPIGDLVVSTPTPYGNKYSDTATFVIHWEGCTGVRAWAFADADHNFNKDGGECFTAFSHDVTVPVRETTWGHIKSLYEGE
jgi:hypothetical protein